MKTKQTPVFLLQFLFLIMIATSVVSAEGIGPGRTIPSNNGATAMTFYAYKKTAGEQIDFRFIKSTETTSGPVTNRLTIKLYSPSGNLAYNQEFLASNPINTVRAAQTNSSQRWEFGHLLLCLRAL